MTRPAPGRIGAAAIAVVVVVVVVGIVAVVGVGRMRSSGADGPPAPPSREPRPLTLAEAGRLARVLLLDQQDGGARFRLRMARLDGSVLELDGVVDWVDHEGRATVRSSRSPEVTEVVWGGDVVLERVAGLGEALGEPAVAWAARPVAAADASDLDLAMHLLVGLANDRSENAVLLTQDDDVRWLREATVRGDDVEVFAYGPRTRYWVRRGTSELVRMEGGGPDDAHSVVVDLLERGPQDVELPDPATVVDRTTIAEQVPAPR